jgi:predicted porin
MKKTLLASAIAAAAFSGAVAAQPAMSTLELTDKMDAMPNFYGNIQYAYTYNDNDVDGVSSGHSDNGTTIGLTHSHAITSGIEGFMKIELEVAAADDKSNTGANGAGLTDLDEAYIGVRGDSFGQVWIGSDDSLYESLIGDYGNWVFEVAGLNQYSSATTGEGDLVQYMSPSFGGVTLFAGIQINGDDEAQGKSYPYQLGASYSMDALTVSVAMDSNDGNTPYSGLTADTSNENSYGIAVEYVIDQLVLDAYYDSRKGLDNPGAAAFDLGFDGEEGRDQYGVMGTYNLGANTFRLAYEITEADAGDLEVDVLTLQALHNVSDNLYVYTEAVRRTRENSPAGLEDEDNQLNLGAVYYF